MYKLALPLDQLVVHSVFHISILKTTYDSHVIQWNYVILDHNLSFEEDPIVILDMQTRNRDTLY